jgi:hypothetical protein
MPTGSASARPARGAADSALACLVRQPGKQKGKGRVGEHRGRGHQVVNAAKARYAPRVAVCREPRQLSGPQTEEPLVIERAR